MKQDRGVNEETRTSQRDAKKAVVELLRSRGKKGRFATEVFAALERSKIRIEDIDRVLTELEASGIVMIRDHFCADPHLEGVDLRIVALVESVDGADPQMSAIREIDTAWDKWLSSYLANHRCG
jgi:hypothetical protein